jgi:hypothetical protein
MKYIEEIHAIILVRLSIATSTIKYIYRNIMKYIEEIHAIILVRLSIATSTIKYQFVVPYS